MGAAVGVYDLERADSLIRAGVDVLVVVGAGAQGIAQGALATGMARARVVATQDVRQAQQVLAEFVRPGDQVLCKASRRVGLDRLVDGLTQLLQQRGAESSHKRPASRSEGQSADLEERHD